ncbi:hypothetical protein HNQ88_000373 [Aureibacter tunicatorum]|uniref:Uncharacterized protein n=2 Tax=Aureibacter tunicatorum TaxID=866807 RepID=A0AAE3XJ97_9BACT|nr:hypothetical protein [Aureibacter tunicatorum]
MKSLMILGICFVISLASIATASGQSNYILLRNAHPATASLSIFQQNNQHHVIFSFFTSDSYANEFNAGDYIILTDDNGLNYAFQVTNEVHEDNYPIHNANGDEGWLSVYMCSNLNPVIVDMMHGAKFKDVALHHRHKMIYSFPTDHEYYLNSPDFKSTLTSQKKKPNNEYQVLGFVDRPDISIYGKDYSTEKYQHQKMVSLNANESLRVWSIVNENTKNSYEDALILKPVAIKTY